MNVSVEVLVVRHHRLQTDSESRPQTLQCVGSVFSCVGGPWIIKGGGKWGTSMDEA